MHGPLGGPFEDHRHRQDGVAVDDVVGQDRHRLEVDPSPQDRLEFPVRGRGRGRPGLLARPGAAAAAAIGQHDDLHRSGAGVPVPDLVDDEAGAGLGRDQVQSFLLEDAPQGIAHHAAGPRTPVERDDAAIRQPDGRLLRPLVEVLVGGGVGDLPDVRPNRAVDEENSTRNPSASGSTASKRLSRPETLVS